MKKTVSKLSLGNKSQMLNHINKKIRKGLKDLSREELEKLFNKNEDCSGLRDMILQEIDRRRI